MHSRKAPSIEEKSQDNYLPLSFTRPSFSRPSSLQTQETPQDVTHSPTQQQHSLLKRREKGHLLLPAPREQRAKPQKCEQNTCLNPFFFLQRRGHFTPPDYYIGVCCCGGCASLSVCSGFRRRLKRRR